MFKSKKECIKVNQQAEIKDILQYEQLKGKFKDLQAENISYLIEYLEDKFIIYVDAEGDLDWEIEDSDLEKAANNVLPRIAILQTKPSVNCFNEKIRLNIWILLGTAIAHCENEQSSSDLISEAEKYIETKEKELTRVWIIGITLLFVGIDVLLLVFSKARFEAFFDTSYLNSCLFGALGSCFSVLLNVGSISVSCSAGRRAVFLECVLKVAVGSISAVIITLAIRCGLIVNGIVNPTKADAFLIIAQIAGGFCERFAPSILEGIENNGQQ